MNTQDEIKALIKEVYSDYTPNMYKPLFYEHAQLRKDIGDEMFLIFLKEKKNSKPIFKTPNLQTV